MKNNNLYKDVVIEEAKFLSDLEDMIKIPIESEIQRYKIIIHQEIHEAINASISSAIGYSRENGHIIQLKITTNKEYYVEIENRYQPLFFEKENSIKNLPESIGNLKFLESLIICDQYLESLPNSMVKLKNLKELNVNDNKISIIPMIIKELKSLETLNLRSNKIESLPEFLWDLTFLKRLDLGNNLIKFIPKSIKKLKNLQYLYLDANFLESLPDSMIELSSLKSLDLQGFGHQIDMSNKQIKDYYEKFNWLSKLNIKANDGRFTQLPEFLKKLMEQDCRININPLRFQPDKHPNQRKLDDFLKK